MSPSVSSPEPNHDNLRQKFVAVFCTVLPSLGNGESLSLLLTSLEACLSGDGDAGVLVPSLVETDAEQLRCARFVSWVLAQLVLVHGQLPDGAARQRATAFLHRLVATLRARDLRMLAGPVTSLWLVALQRLTTPSLGSLRLVDADDQLPAVECTLPTRGTERAAFRLGAVRLLLGKEILSAVLLPGAQFDAAITHICKLSGTNCHEVALEAVQTLKQSRPLNSRLQLLLARLEHRKAAWRDLQQRNWLADHGIVSKTGGNGVCNMDVANGACSAFGKTAPEQWSDSAASIIQQCVEGDSRVSAATEIGHLMLSRVETATASDFPAIYQHCVETVSRIASLGGSGLDISLAVISLPWLGDEVNWFDFRPRAEAKSQLERVISKLGVPSCRAQLATSCLQLLSRLPRALCPQWRSQLAVRLLPDSDVTTDLLPRAVISFTKTAAVQLTAQLAAAGAQLTTPLGQLVCLSAGRACVIMPTDCREPPTVSCAVCNALGPVHGTPFTEASVPTTEACALVTSALSTFSGTVADENRRVLSCCLRHATDKAVVVQAVLSRTDAVDWAPGLRPMVTGQLSDWQQSHTLLCEWLSTVDESTAARALSALLYPTTVPAAPLIPEIVPSLLAALQRPLLSTVAPVAASAHLSLRQLARRCHMTAAQLWAAHRAVVCRALVDSLIASDAALSQLSAASAAWDLRGLDTLLRAGGRHLLPPLLVVMATGCRKELLHSAAAVLNTKPKDLLIDNYPHIMSCLILSGRRAELGTVHQFITSTTGLGISEIRRCSIQGQVNELVSALHEQRDDVIRELGCLVRLEADGSGGRDAAAAAGDAPPLEQVVTFLSSRLLGVLGWVDTKLGSRSASDAEKCRLLQSLAELCQLLGRPAVSAVSHKLLATLKAGLLVPGVPQVEVWTALILTLEPTALRGLAAELIVTLEQLPTEHRTPVMRCLFTEREKDLRPIADELPELDCAAQYGCGAVILRGSQATLPERLSRVVRNLAHPNLLVRQHVLLRLRQLLLENCAKLAKLLMTGEAESCEQLISRLMDALLASCRDADATIQRMVAECVGTIGAIDPARLTTSEAQVTSAQTSPPPAVTSDEFAAALLSQLGRAFSAAADATAQAYASFAMQEVLKLSGVSGGSNDALWGSLSAELRPLLAPFRTSRYQLSAGWGRQAQTGPVYGTEEATGHVEWAGLWLSRLITLVRGSQASLLLAACRPIACRDLTLAGFLLPHVLLSALTDGDDEVRSVTLAEIEAVLRDRRPAGDSGSMNADLDISELHRSCCRSVFSVLDAVTAWRLSRLQQCGSSSRQLEALRTSDTAYRAVTDLLDKVPFDLVAKTSRRCGAQKRALQAVEIHLSRHPDQLEQWLPLLQELYVILSEPDGVAGVSAKRAQTPSIADQLVLYESRGQMHRALSCYEQVCNTPGSELVGYRGLISCYLSLDQPSTALSLARDMMQRRPEWEEPLSEQLVEATWRLGKWEELESAMECVPLDAWSAGVGAALLHADARQTADFERRLGFCREQEMLPLSVAALEPGSYSRAYEHLVRLHILSDLERSLPALLWTEAAPEPEPELETWRLRYDTLQPAVHTLEPVLSARRAALHLARDRLRVRGCQSAADKLELEIGRCWLLSARVSRAAGQLQRASNCLLQLQPLESRLPDAFVERASLLWLRGEGDAAIRVLRHGILAHFPDWSASIRAGSLPSARRETLAEAKLLLARYCEESANMDSNVINQLFVEVTEVRKDWEDVHFYTAKYLDRLLAALPAGGRDSSQLGPRVVHALGKSLQYGCHHVYESMPRLLSIWLDYGSSNSNVQKTRDSQPSQTTKSLELMCRRMGQLLDSLPLYCFLTSLSQIISRICHGSTEVYAQLRQLLASLLATYPKQCMWHMLAVSRSSYPMRVERCRDVFARATAKQPSLSQFISDSAKLADKLIDLSNKPVDKKTQRVSLAAFFPGIRRLVSSGFSEILVPLQEQMTVTLPATASQHGFKFQPFSETQVCIAGFEDEVDVMPSLVRPKRITLRGTDGKKYTMMAKPKDDLRKDSRLMEFNRLVNRHLARDAEARNRRLHIRTYTVIPLNDECGLLEWVPNLNGLRQVLLTLYRQRGNMMTNAELKQISPQLDDSLERKRKIFTEQLLPRHPAVLSRWFLATFGEPQAWYTARLNYSRTAAVMSMIGYVLGLGDRHGENILLDASCGDCVHVDFNCLFNKGELFDWPERVPFRLTHNMTDALGPLGVEGVYRTACEVVMTVVRQQQEALMCVLRPFIHDPLVEWSRSDRRPRDVAEIVNEKAQAHVGDIEQRLRGQVRSKLKPVPIPLSVPGQVNYLIEEATSLDNLCQMYIGWAAHF